MGAATGSRTLWVSFIAVAGLVAVQWRRITSQLKRLQEDLEHARCDHRGERTGRIRALEELKNERQLRLQLQLQVLSQLQNAQASGEAKARVAGGAAEGVPADAMVGMVGDGAVAVAVASSGAAGPGLAPLLPAVFPLAPIGYAHSCFSSRNGTPRQPLLVGAARCRIQLVDFPAAALDGLDQYSHVWVLYLFHANTDMHRKMDPHAGRKGQRSKINVPRLNGARMGVLATRSPHRPCPIGLSVAQVIAVEGNSLLLGGADIVDGSPVLDIKPYVPFCDALPDAGAPAWVKAEADDEPLSISEVAISPEAEQSVRDAWEARRREMTVASGGSARGLYATADEYLTLVRQVLSRDFRPLHKRMAGPDETASKRLSGVVAGPGRAADGASAGGGDEGARAKLDVVSREGSGTAHWKSAPNSAAPSYRRWEQKRYQVILDGIVIWYDMDGTRVVVAHAMLETTNRLARGDEVKTVLGGAGAMAMAVHRGAMVLGGGETEGEGEGDADVEAEGETTDGAGQGGDADD